MGNQLQLIKTVYPAGSDDLNNKNKACGIVDNGGITTLNDDGSVNFTNYTIISHNETCQHNQNFNGLRIPYDMYD